MQSNNSKDQTKGRYFLKESSKHENINEQDYEGDEELSKPNNMERGSDKQLFSSEENNNLGFNKLSEESKTENQELTEEEQNTTKTPTELTETEIDDYIKKIANTSDELGIDDPYPCEKEFNSLKHQPNQVIPRINYYLENFSQGNASSIGCETWYYGGKHLIRLLADINNEESMQVIANTLSMKSNVAEWYWNIQSQSAIELGNTKDKKWLPVLNDALNDSMAPINKINEAIEKISGQPSKDPKIILNNAESKMEGLELIEYLYQLKDDMESWSSQNKAYYYYLLAVNSEKVGELKNTTLPKAFYAAQVYENPVNTSFGWMKFDETPGAENAKKLHEKYPIPQTFEEIKNLEKYNQEQTVIKDEKTGTSDTEGGSEENKVSEKEKILNEYLNSIGKSKDDRTKDFDSKLVEVNSEGNITDYNNPLEIFKDIGKYYAIIIVLLLIIWGIVSVFRGFWPAVIICILVFIIVVCAFMLIIGFAEKIRSSRDITHKFLTSLYILPLIALFIYSSLTFGFFETLMVIGVILIVAVLGFVFLAICGAFK